MYTDICKPEQKFNHILRLLSIKNSKNSPGKSNSLLQCPPLLLAPLHLILRTTSLCRLQSFAQFSVNQLGFGIKCCFFVIYIYICEPKAGCWPDTLNMLNIYIVYIMKIKQWMLQSWKNSLTTSQLTTYQSLLVDSLFAALNWSSLFYIQICLFSYIFSNYWRAFKLQYYLANYYHVMFG